CSEPSAGPCRWARLRTGHGGRRCSRRSALWAVELRREESRRGLEDRVRPTQLLHLLLEGLDPRGVLTRRAGLQALVDVSSLDPLAHRLDAVPELVRDPLDRPVLGAQLTTQLAHQPDRLGLLLLRVPTRRRLPRHLFSRPHSILISRVWSLQRTPCGSLRRRRLPGRAAPGRCAPAAR